MQAQPSPSQSDSMAVLVPPVKNGKLKNARTQTWVKTKDRGNVTLYGQYNKLLPSFSGTQVVGRKTCDVGVQCEIIGNNLQRTSTPEPESMSDTDINTTMEMESEFEDPELPQSSSLSGLQ